MSENTLVPKQIFTPEQVFWLNEGQHNKYRHPFTCGSGNRTEHPDREGILVATIYGWICPYCDYHQDWAHDWMLNNSSSCTNDQS